VTHRSTAELDDCLPHIRSAPNDGGALELIVRRPASGEREVLDTAQLDAAVGLEGDTWKDRPSRKMPGNQPHPDMQLNIMNVRAIAAISPDAGRWPLAGDQLYLDLDISVSNLPPGTRLAVGDAVIEVTAEPHTGCAKFTERFGLEAMRWVNSAEGKALRLRGMNARVVRSGTIRVGDTARKLAVPAEV
jgi:MOSC domain-containing protein YiiM